MKALLRSTVDHFLLLPIGGLLALVWANVAAESYFVVARGLTFWVNDVAMALFFAIIAQEVIEEVMPGGALHTWRRWWLPILAAAGSMAGAALVYLAYVNWKYELVLRDGWPAATAIDIAVAYVLVRSLFKRHPAVPFVLIVAIAANVAGLIVVASRQEFVRVDPGGVSIMFVALSLAAIMRVLVVKSFWPYLLVCGPLSWWSLYAVGLNPALALVPIIPFIQHTRRSLVLFEDRPHSGHDSPTHFEHVFMYPVHAVLFLFAFVNAGVLLSAYGTGTWALVAASLVGKPVGLLAATAIGVGLGLHLPRGLHWRDLTVVALATCGGFAIALFFATSVYPIGPVLGELKLGAIVSGIGVPITIVVAWLLKVGRFKTPHPGLAAHHGGVVAATLVIAFLIAPRSAGSQAPDDMNVVLQTRVSEYLALRQEVRRGVEPEHIINPYIRDISDALLAARLRQARAGAEEGDVLVAALAHAIRERLAQVYESVDVDILLTSTYPEGAPTEKTRLNAHYDDATAVRVPALALARLPPLPDSLGYRLIGRDIVLWDDDARIVIDVVAAALREPHVWRFLNVSSVDLRQRVKQALQAAHLEPQALLEEMASHTLRGVPPPLVEMQFDWCSGAIMPPSLLNALPALPTPLEYRLVGPHLVVIDIDTGLVKGVLNDALPGRLCGARTLLTV